MDINRVAFSEAKTIPNAPGVYAFYSADTCLYVGKSQTLRTRLRSGHHRLLNLLEHNVSAIEYMLINDVRTLELVEQGWIMDRQPILNKLAGRPPIEVKRNVLCTLSITENERKAMLAIAIARAQVTNKMPRFSQIMREALAEYLARAEAK